MSRQLENVKQRDTPEFKFTLTDKTGAAFDLTDRTVQFGLKDSISDADGEAIVDRACSIDAPATLGIARITLTSAETQTPGEYVAEVKVIGSGTERNRTATFIIRIQDAVIQLA